MERTTRGWPGISRWRRGSRSAGWGEEWELKAAPSGPCSGWRRWARRKPGGRRGRSSSRPGSRRTTVSRSRCSAIRLHLDADLPVDCRFRIGSTEPMRIVYFTIDNVNDNVILAQTFPMLGRLAGLPGVERIDLFALQKTGGEEYRRRLPASVRVRVGRNHGIWHPWTWFHLARLSVAAWACARPGAVLFGRNPISLCCLGLAALRRRTRLILDYRGVLSEEYVLQGKVARRGWLHRLLRRLEGWALGRADGILCVSERLRRRCRGWRPDAAKNAVVIPCCYDPNLARRDDMTVERLRAELEWTLRVTSSWCTPDRFRPGIVRISSWRRTVPSERFTRVRSFSCLPGA